VSWRESAACRELAGWWFQRRPADKDKARVHDEARKTICRNCPVLEECREEARRLMEPSGVWGGESPEERCKRLDLTHGPVARCCASCGELFTPTEHSGTKTCSQECSRRYHNDRKNREAAAKRANSPSKSRPCPRCGETQNMAAGVCMGWVCVRARKVEARSVVA